MNPMEKATEAAAMRYALAVGYPGGPRVDDEFKAMMGAAFAAGLTAFLEAAAEDEELRQVMLDEWFPGQGEGNISAKERVGRMVEALARKAKQMGGER